MLAPLAFLDQERQTPAVVGDEAQVALEAHAFLPDLLAQPEQFGEVGAQHLGLMSHLGEHGAQHHGRAHRCQDVLRTNDERGRCLPADPLQGRKHLGDEVAPLFQGPRARPARGCRGRASDRGSRDPLLQGPNPGGGFNQLMFEFALIVGERLISRLRRPWFSRALRCSARSVSFLLMLPERIAVGGRRSRRASLDRR